MINTVFTDILRTADSDHEIYFLLTSYIEAVRFSKGSKAMPADLQRLPLHDAADVQERFERLIPELDAASKGLDDSQNPHRWWNTGGDWKDAGVDGMGTIG